MSEPHSPNNPTSDGAEPSSTNQLWGGRFNEPTDEFVARLTASVDFDQRLYREDIQGSIAHATMLNRVGVLTENESATIIAGLQRIESEIAAGEFAWSVPLEDVHMNIEARLTALVGDVGKKLHTGRSRNDQIATDIRLFLRTALDQIDQKFIELETALVDLAEREADTIMPGFTHLQAAQPVTFGHHMMAWYEMCRRDRSRFADCRARMNELPLGAAALAGSTFPLDRNLTTELLAFDRPCANSLDAVSDRDFAIEFVSAASILLIHMSRWSEELVLWASTQFDFVELPDRFCTGSSIMPQKKNPDVPELIRGKSGRVAGHLTSLQMLMKGQPLTYNKDNQEDKEPLFDTVDTVLDCLKAYADMVPAIQPKRENLLDATTRGYATATDLADYLVRAGMPFRDAHEVVGKSVGFAVERGVDLAELELRELQQFSDLIQPDVYNVLTPQGSVAARDHIGGTAPNQVRIAVTNARQEIAAPR